MGKDKFIVRADPDFTNQAVVMKHSMFDSIVGVVADVCNMLVTFVELRPEAEEESCLLHEHELSGVPLTVLRVIAKTEKEFAKVIIDAILRSKNKTTGLLHRFDENGFIVLEFNDTGKKYALKRIVSDRCYDEQKEYTESLSSVNDALHITDEADKVIGNKILNVLNSEYSKQICISLDICPPWTYDETEVTVYSAVSKNKRYQFRQDFVEMCDNVFGRKAIDRKLAVFAGVTLGAGLYLDLANKEE